MPFISPILDWLTPKLVRFSVVYDADGRGMSAFCAIAALVLLGAAPLPPPQPGSMPSKDVAAMPLAPATLRCNKWRREITSLSKVLSASAFSTDMVLFFLASSLA